MASILRYFNELRTWSVIAIADVFSDTQSANQVFAGPTTGAAAAPTFRTLVVADAPIGLVLLNTLTAANQATLDDTTDITATYDEYMFVLRGIVPATANSGLRMRVSINGGGLYQSTTYLSTVSGGYAAGTNGVGSANDAITDGILLSSNSNTNFDGVSSNSNWGISGTIFLHNPNSTGLVAHVTGSVTWLASPATRVNSATVSGAWGSVGSPINAVRFLFGAGNITSGTIKVYGIKTS